MNTHKHSEPEAYWVDDYMCIRPMSEFKAENYCGFGKHLSFHQAELQVQQWQAQSLRMANYLQE